MMQHPESMPGRRYRGLSQHERQAERREALLIAGYRVFGERGLIDSTVNDICSAASVANRFCKDHFDSIDKLFDAVCEQQETLLNAQLEETANLHAAQRDPGRLAQALLTTFYEFFHSDPRRVRLLLIDRPWRQACTARQSVSASFALPPLQELGLHWVSHVVGSPSPNQAWADQEQQRALMLLNLLLLSTREWALRGFDTPLRDMVCLHLSFWQRHLPELQAGSADAQGMAATQRALTLAKDRPESGVDTRSVFRPSSV